MIESFENIKVGDVVLTYSAISYPSWANKTFLVKRTVDRVTPKQFSLESVPGKFRKSNGTRVGERFSQVYLYDKSKDQTIEWIHETEKIAAYNELVYLLDLMKKADFKDVSLISLQSSVISLSAAVAV